MCDFHWYQNWWPCMTLNCYKCKLSRNLAQIRILGGKTAKRMKIDTQCQQQKCSPMSLVSENIRCMQVFATVCLGRGVKWEWGRRRRPLSAISVATSSETLQIRLSVLHDDMLPMKFVAKWTTYNDLECLFMSKSVFELHGCRAIGFLVTI